MITQTKENPCIVSLSNHPQLFLDDHCVGWTVNMTRQMQPAKKYEDNPIIEEDHPWEKGLLASPSVCYDAEEDLFRMRYTAFDAQPFKEPAVCYAESGHVAF